MTPLVRLKIDKIQLENMYMGLIEPLELVMVVIAGLA